jgi:hypothetical protein
MDFQGRSPEYPNVWSQFDVQNFIGSEAPNIPDGACVFMAVTS